MDDGRAVVEGIRKCFENVPDPRVVGRCAHLLIDILTISILAVICSQPIRLFVLPVQVRPQELTVSCVAITDVATG